MSGQWNFGEENLHIAENTETGVAFALQSLFRAGRKLYVRSTHSVVALSCLLCVFVLLAGGEPAFAQKVDIDKPIGMARRDAGKLWFEIRKLVREENYEEGWSKCKKLIRANTSHWVQQYQALGLMAQIALADPDVSEDGKARLELGIDILEQFTERIRNTPREDIDYGVEYAFLSESSFELVLLATVCGEQDTAGDLLDKIYDLAYRANFSGYKEAIKRRKKFLDMLVRYLAIFGKAEKATKLLQRHWRFLEGEEVSNPHAIRGLALLRVGKFLEKHENVPIAATYFVRAVDHLEKVEGNVENESSRVKKAKTAAKSKVEEYGMWAHVKKVAYEDHEVLKKKFQQLADQLAIACSNRNVEGVLKLVANKKNKRKKIKTAFARSDFHSIKWSIGSIGPVKTTDKHVSVVSECTIVRNKGGEEVSGTDTLAFVRKNGKWKISFLAKEGGYDEEEE